MSSPLQGYRIGFIGLGVMGRPMAAHLHTAGAEMHVHNRSRSVVDACAEAGMQAASTPSQMAETLSGEIIVLMLTNTEAVESVVLGPEGLANRLSPGTLILDMSTTGLKVTEQCAAAVQERSGAWVDAPVSGGQVGAEGACLTIMAGGQRDDFQHALPVLQVLGDRITLVGDLGAGQVAKLANQIIVAQTITAISEALTLARSAGVDPAQVRDAIRGGFAESRILAEHGERMVTGNFQPGGRSRLQLKDVREAALLMDQLDVDLPMLRQNHALWEEMVHDHDLGEIDHSGMYQLYERKNGS